ncbi:MAG TPA: ATPase, T2SS/T4P/T4SS family [Patescibacteria group bacterium]|nr:ATPase, T2SS/T4P/T4SS family [Patescibacteria group bacterium]
MSDNFQSVENLIRASKGEKMDEETVQGKFQKKNKEIKIKQLEEQTKKQAQQMGLPYINLFGFPLSPEALSLIEEEQANELNAVCFYYDGKNMRIASTNPEKKEVKELLKEKEKDLHVNAKLYLISKHSLDYALKVYKSLPKVENVRGGVKIEEEDLKKFKEEITDYKKLDDKIGDVNTSSVVTLILATAIKTDSSDVHIEAEEDGIKVRFRIDGVLQEAANIDKDKWKKIVSRMKLLAGVKINITDSPQDGRYTIFLDQEEIEVRSSFLPTNYGESVVMRLLRSSSINVPFEELGLMPQAHEILKREMKKPNGMILTTGPTGSGKTTTLYAILKKLNNPETKIITLENPVEYHLEGINQSQVEPDKGYTFAKGLRSILRQDPDIVMVGEIRDLDTAEIATQASLTGHLVLSTLHTNDSSGVVPRLIDMGVKPYFLTPSINAIIGQRLVRRLCPKCKKEHELEDDEREKVEKILAVISPKSGVDTPNKIPKIYKVGDGCEHCNGIGYKGRVGIYEIFTMADNIKQLATDNAPAFKILQQAIENGMVTMLQDGVLKALDGVTSLDEVYRVIGKTDYIDTLYDIVISKTFGRGVKLTEKEMNEGWEMAMNINDVDKDRISNIPNKEMVNIILATAIKSNAGDIHIEPEAESVKVRFRIDGILHDFLELSKDHYLNLLSRIKILAGFPTNVKKATWDGRFSIFIKDDKMDCRVSIISGGYGETVVIRLLANQAASLDMKELGMRSYALDPVKKSMKKTKGIIVNTGPTGSGKTTTLYSILNKLNQSDVKIITIEDPIEYHLEGVMQTQVNPDEGYTFAKAIRSLLRQNPNIMMVGEIRDKETADVAIEASQTGHLVLSTVHANSAAGAVTRFMTLDIDKQILANSLECTIGQRLVRRVCPNCKVKDEVSEERMEEVKKTLENLPSGVKPPKNLEFYKGKGCKECNHLGYKGRVGVYEVIEMNGPMQKIVQRDHVTYSEIEEEAVKQGTVLMFQDGILKALEGKTSLDEIYRVIQ